MTTFIDEHRDAYGVEPICSVLPIAPSTYYAQKSRQLDSSRLSARAKRDAALRVEIERVWNETGRSMVPARYGVSFTERAFLLLAVRWSA